MSVPEEAQQHLTAVIQYVKAREPWEIVPGFVEDLLLDGLELPPDRCFELMEILRAMRAGPELRRMLAGEPALVSAEELVAEELVHGRAEAVIFREPMLTAAEAGIALGSSSSTKPSQYAHKLRQAGELLGLPFKNTYVFPLFQFEVPRPRVKPTVARVNRLLGAREDPWGAASWWLTPNARIDGRTPRDLVDSDADALLAIAEAEAVPLDP